MTTLREARALAERYMATALPRRWKHVQAVVARAEELAGVPGVDPGLLVTAAWLHDVGYSPELVDTGFHPVDGARFVRAKGAVERLAGLVAHHSAAYIEAEERGLGGQLMQDFEREESPTSDALWFCDLTSGPDGQRFAAEERLAEIQERYGPGHVVTRFVERARPVLLAAVRRTELLVAAADGHPT